MQSILLGDRAQLLESFCSVYFLWPCCGVTQGSLCLSGGGLMVLHSSAPHHVFFFFFYIHIYCMLILTDTDTSVQTNSMLEMAGCPSNHCTSTGLRPLLNEWPPFSIMILTAQDCIVSLLYDIYGKLHIWDFSTAWMKKYWLDKVKITKSKIYCCMYCYYIYYYVFGFCFFFLSFMILLLLQHLFGYRVGSVRGP